MSEKDWKNNLWKKNCPKSFSLDLQISFLITPPNLFRQSSEKKSVFCPKKVGKMYVLKNIFPPKIFLWTRRMQFQQIRQKKDKRPRTSAQCLKMTKNFICFPKQFIFKKRFYRYVESSFDRPAKLFLLNYQNWSEKSRQKWNYFSNFFSAKYSYGELESSLKAPLTS